jgi:hypothetical protein
MHSVRIVLGVMVAVLLTGVTEAANQVYTFSSQHYDITTDVHRDLAKHIARHMDVVYEDFARRFSGFKGRGTDRQPLHVYQTADSYLRFIASHGLNGQGSGGMFFVQKTGSALATFVEGRDRNRMYRTLRHEGFHQFAWSRLGPALPLWANEGMAEYFGEALITSKGMKSGYVPPDRLAKLKKYIASGRHIPLATLMNISSAEWANRLRSDQDTTQYDQVWSLVHFLLNSDARFRKAFGLYLEMLGRGEAAPRAYAKAFGSPDYQLVERAWLKHVEGMQPSPEKVAEQRLSFLAGGLSFLREKGTEPNTLLKLKTELQAVRFRLRKPIGFGMVIELTSEDDTMFEAPRAPGRITLEMLPPRIPSLPPQLRVRGLSVIVKLSWFTDSSGRAVPQVIYE